MKKQVAIKYVEIRMKSEFIGDDVKQAGDMAIEALEKQIPKKPHYEGDGYSNGELVYDTWRCPNCDEDYEVEFEEHDYCPYCGQRIDWSE